MSPNFEQLQQEIQGDLFTDITTRTLYATDASVYKELPRAVCRPKSEADVEVLIHFARKNNLPLIPRTAGTSLAGQVVGNGMVVDLSKYMNRILELNTEEKWVRVQPGVILDELNNYLKPHNLFFGPETSTSNRCMMGGMLANNSCGSHSLIYGSTRDHTLEAEAFLSDGSKVKFEALSNEEFQKKCIGNALENKLYSHIFSTLSDKKLQEEIRLQYPDSRINRRNTGYALDILLNTEVFTNAQEKFNFCKLLAGSEGSLAVFTSVKLNLVDLPPKHTALVCVHVRDIEEALHTNLTALNHQPVAVELIDKIVLECTKTNISQARNRFFIKGEPEAILAVEFAENNPQTLDKKITAMIEEMQSKGQAYHYPILRGQDINKAWALRKAGLGLLSNMPGDAKPVAVIEDTAVHPSLLPDFVKELKTILEALKITCVYYAHIGSGEIHLRPILNLKNPADVEKFYHIALETAKLVKKYKGSLSGEHGDGRLRGEFIPLMLGEKLYETFQELKKTWDPQNIFNPGKITDTPSMKTFFRYEPGKPDPEIKTWFRYPESAGFMRGIEKCNGSGDCRKTYLMKGVMCPSYHATMDEHHTTRGRANALREFINNADDPKRFDLPQVKEVLDLCLSCKACKSECPSNVDMAKYKAEFLQKWHEIHGLNTRSKMIASYTEMNRLASLIPGLYNFFTKQKPFATLIKKMSGFHPGRSLPALQKQSWRRWAKTNLKGLNKGKNTDKSVVLFCDEFTNYNDAHIGIACCELLSKLGYYIIMPQHGESGRAAFSKGVLSKAQKAADKNIRALASFAEKGLPIIGIEPSCILSFRDEYKDICSQELTEKALLLAQKAYMIDEFIALEHEKGAIRKEQFLPMHKKVYFHGHCHQKALSGNSYSVQMLSIPQGIEVCEIECGCCGMAGSFGYEKEHFDISIAIAELKLFPAIRKAEPEALISATGTSCRHQIWDGTQRKAIHPLQILHQSAI